VSKIIVHAFHSIGMLMDKTLRLVILCAWCSVISACSTLYNHEISDNGNAQWDFDHNVQFTQIKLAKNTYQLEIIPNSKVNFERLATFLLRKSYNLCGGYHYKLEIIQGIEGFDDKRAMPNYVFPSLIAKVTCKKK